MLDYAFVRALHLGLIIFLSYSKSNHMIAIAEPYYLKIWVDFLFNWYMLNFIIYK